MTLSRADVQDNCNIITTVPFFGSPTILPLASLAVRFAITGKPSHKQNLLKTSKTVDMYNKCPVLKDLHFN